MKRRQVMALILAAALALPNTGVVAEIAGAPVTVEAAARAAEDEADLTVAVDPDESTKVVKAALEEAAADAKVKKRENAATVGDVIKVSSGWKLLNGGDALKRGGDNTARLRYTCGKEVVDAGNGWEQDGGLFYAEFEVKFEVVEAIAPATVFESTKWPELTDKTFKGEGTNKTYWGDDLKSGSSSYGTFSVDETAVSGAGNDVEVTVTFKLNPGYEFAGDDTIDGISMSEGETTCEKDYTVNVRKQVIDKIEWPEIKIKDASKAIEGGKITEALEVSAAAGNDGKAEFSLCKEDKTSLADSDTLAKGINKLKIKATVASAHQANFEIAEKDAYKDVSFDVAAPVMNEVGIQWKLKSGADSTYADAAGGVSNDGKGGPLTLKAIDEWSVAIAGDVKGRVYDVKYQWYKNGTKINGANAETLEVATTDAGEYSCEVSAGFAETATKDDMAFYKEQPVKSSKKINIAFSEIAMGQIAVKYDGGTSYTPAEYGQLKTDVEYTVPVNNASDKAEMSLAVEKDGADVTSAVSGKISGKISADGRNFVITVDKSANAGAYAFKVKVKDGNNTVILTNANLKCEIAKQTVALATAQIKALNKEIVHGDKFDKLTGFEYAAAENSTTDEKRAAKAINDKVAITVSDYKNGSSGFQNGYFEATSGKPVVVNVELKDNYKKDYKLSGLTSLTPAKDDVQTATSNIKVEPKKITLGVENLEIIKGQGLPKRTITGADFLEADGVTVEEKEWKLYEKNDKTQKVIKNSVKSLNPGEYIVSVDLEADGTGVGNYKINDVAGSSPTSVNVRAELVIYESEHTVGFVSYGDANIADSKVYHGKALGTLPTPVRAGYKFIGWYSDKNFTKAYNGAEPVMSNIILYAKWEKAASENSQNPSASAVKVGTTAKTSAGTFYVTNVSKKTVAYKSASKSAKKVTIPSSVKINGVAYKVTKVGNNAFSGRTKLTKVTIPSSVTEIGTSSFKNCKKLTSVTIPKNVTKIGKNAFYGCKKLKKVTIQSKKIKSIGKNAFKSIAKKPVIKTPKGKKTAYKKILKKSGYRSSVK